MSFPNVISEPVTRSGPGVPAGTELPVDASLADHGLDSRAAVNLVLDPERRFAVPTPDAVPVRSRFHAARTLREAWEEVLTGPAKEESRPGPDRHV
jgi:acyl carrier protein